MQISQIVDNGQIDAHTIELQVDKLPTLWCVNYMASVLAEPPSPRLSTRFPSIVVLVAQARVYGLRGRPRPRLLLRSHSNVEGDEGAIRRDCRYASSARPRKLSKAVGYWVGRERNRRMDSRAASPSLHVVDSLSQAGGKWGWREVYVAE